MNPASPKLIERRRQYALLKSKYLQEHPVCEACKKVRSSQIHHKAGRAGEWLTYVPLFMAVCSGCHAWIEAYKATAERHGWVVRIRSTFKQYLKSHESPKDP